ncbi:hypothetical protein G7Y79_00005g016500 [Physcia stellaris]|nr:hypothetical protein G7Y79_00005g016500 [Physcia stellaris]
MLISLTVGKVDAGVAVLLTEDKRLIEFPSILLPPSISSGSIVDITVSRNTQSEAASQKAFSSLQNSILTTFGISSPSPPILRCRNATQTSVVLEWDPIQLATADLRSLSLYRNGSKAGAIPRPMDITSTKISGLALDTEYTFYLVLKTSAGMYSSEKLAVRTHKMTDLSGITVTPGFLPAPLRESLGSAVERIGAKMAETVRIDTTHFVCTEGRGTQWEKALEMNIPVVRPEWVEGYPRLRNPGPGVGVQQGIGSGQPPRPPMLQNRRTESQSTMPTRGNQNPASPSNLGTERPTASPVSESGPAPPPPAKDTPALERREPPESPSTVQSVESAEVHVTSPSEPDQHRISREVVSDEEDEGPRKEAGTPGDSASFTEVAL